MRKYLVGSDIFGCVLTIMLVRFHLFGGDLLGRCVKDTYEVNDLLYQEVLRELQIKLCKASFASEARN